MTTTHAQRVTAPFGARTAPVTAHTRHGPYVVLECADAGGPVPRAGQFYMLMAAHSWGGGAGERPYLPRAFSVLRAAPAATPTAARAATPTAARAATPAAAPGDQAAVALQFLVEDVGPGTNRLCELGPGDGLSLVGPLGNGFTPPRDGRRALLVGGGVGIAPLAILQDQLGDDATAILGFRDAAHAAGAGLLRDPRVATDDGSAGYHGLVTDLLDRELDDDQHVEVYACGPPAMLETVRLTCTVREIPAQLALESGMACGFGACFGCVVQTRHGYVRLCLDGPVLDAADLGPLR